MDKLEAAMKCMELATLTVGSSVTNRVDEIKKVSTTLFNHVMVLTGDAPAKQDKRSKSAVPDNLTPLSEDKSGNATATKSDEL